MPVSDRFDNRFTPYFYFPFSPFSIPMTVGVTPCFNFTEHPNRVSVLSDLSQRLLPHKYNMDREKVNNAFLGNLGPLGNRIVCNLYESLPTY